MRKWLINKVKYSSFIYSAYYYCGTGLLHLLRLFIKQDPNLILFSSFGGRKFDDSPRAIYNELLKDGRFKNCKIIWAFMNPEAYDLSLNNKIKIDTFRFYKMALKARIWITNSSMERGLSFKSSKTFCLNTWHGTPIKKMGADLANDNKSFDKKGKSSTDIMLAQSSWEADVFSRVFRIPRDNFRITGLPRNDKLAHIGQTDIYNIKNKLNLPNDKIIILYAPTFREFNQSSKGVILDIPINFKKWQEQLGNKYILLFRAHYEVAKSMNILDNEFIRNVSDYPSLEDLMIASDILISDYSSILFDYSITSKPMLCFVYDYDEYAKKRGVYFDIRKELGYAEDEDRLLQLIKTTQVNKPSKETELFRNKFVNEYGNATQETLNIIAKELNI